MCYSVNIRLKCTLKVGTKINFLLLVFTLLFCNSIELCFAQLENL